MSIKSFALAGAAIVALSMGASIAQADDQDDEVRQLNLEQLEKAKAGGSDATAPAPATQPDGQGGPELQGPPTPDEGMTDEPADEPAAEEGDEPATDDPATEEDQPEPKPE
jgi:hypothetical protein